MTPDKFISTWKDSTLKERSASQSHFNDLCTLLEVERPTDVDPKGEWYCFERGASKTAGGEGWADVWKHGHFGWEYKGKRKDLTAAFAQLQQYAVALENPPLLIVSDMDRIIVHTNWTNTVSEVHTIQLEDLRDAGKRDLLRWALTDPERLKPAKTIDALTREAADKFAGLAIRLHERGHEPHQVAHFVNRLVFCMFAEDINLLPRHLFTQLLDRAFHRPNIAQGLLEQLFAAMKAGGLFGIDEIEWFNGGLFDDAAALPLTRDDLQTIGEAASLDWSDIDPSIFGTLFERGLDPAKRSQLGAHYTDPEKIMMIVRPVILEPLWREWEAVKTAINKPRIAEKRRRDLFGGFLERLRQFRVLDPACGSGNFLYLALLALKDLEHRVNLEAEAMGFGRQFPTVGPQAVNGIEINPYAAELARVTVWIGEIQWMRKNGFDFERRPILKPLDNIENRDALLNKDGSEAEWPVSDAIIGNPPFLGRQEAASILGKDYLQALRTVYRDRVPGQADLVTYWFVRAISSIEKGALCGLVSTNSIRRGVNRKVLDDVVAVCSIFSAYADLPWVLDGAAVRVSIVCFSKSQQPRSLEGVPVVYIQSDLTGGTEQKLTPRRLTENHGIAFVGGQKDGPFEIPEALAEQLLRAPLNPNGQPNSDVVRPWCNGRYLAQRRLEIWIIDFGERTEEEAALYELPFGIIAERVKPVRQENNDPRRKKLWWLHGRPGTNAKSALGEQSYFLATPLTSKHRWFIRLRKEQFPDNTIVLITRSDWVTFGIISSRIHCVWALRYGNFLGVGNDARYTPSTTFDTFPFPAGLSPDRPRPACADALSQAIGKAAEVLNQRRESWLNPSDLVKAEPGIIPGAPERIVAVNESATLELKQRTLTSLYNTRPAWLDNAHRALDSAVAAAYGWNSDLTDDEVLSRLLALNLERSSTSKVEKAGPKAAVGAAARRDSERTVIKAQRFQ